MLTPSTIRAAALEIQTGDRVSLDWALNLPSYPSFSRPPLEWRFHHKTHPDGSYRSVNDDYLTFNTQGSSQWDGFRHYGYQKAQLYYGGRSQADIEGGGVIGIDRVVEAGGITGRGVVLDYPRWRAKRGLEEVDALSARGIGVEELRAMVEESGVQTREGDLLLLRTGFTKAYEALGEGEKEVWMFLLSLLFAFLGLVFVLYASSARRDLFG